MKHCVPIASDQHLPGCESDDCVVCVLDRSAEARERVITELPALTGVIALTMSMALELAPVVRVNAVSPGYVLTPMQRAEYSDAMLDAVNCKIPFGRHARHWVGNIRVKCKYCP